MQRNKNTKMYIYERSDIKKIYFHRYKNIFSISENNNFF